MKIIFVSLGCDKNLVDSEKMLGLLADRGYAFTDDEKEADVAVVNTCTFIGDAKEESIQTLIDLGTLKQSGHLKALIAAGCLAQRYSEEIKTELPEVDAVVGTMAIEKIADAVDDVLAGNRNREYMEKLAYLAGVKNRRIASTGGYYAYLKIAEGCDKRCTYCVIPSVRGRYRSVPMEDLIREAQDLVSQGVKELILVAQETTLYGADLYGKKSLSVLLRRLNEINDLKWIRILYCYPEEIDEDLIRTMRECEKVVHYLDLPIQHASDRILKRMGRRTNHDDLCRIIQLLRQEIPDIALRTTLISGFPGETQEEFEELYRFVNETEFDRLGVFAYSQEEDTPAASFPDQIPEEIKENRRSELMELQQEIAFEKAESLSGQLLYCVIEGKLYEDEVYIGRTYRDAPGVDGYIFIQTDESLMSGDFVWARVTGSRDYDLIGELYHESAE
ncbi:MAG: 30S ribosomal protein S12 methylthiotransferase RimO [Lachnospiraceae bacterium]|nr:30S ribosomal protein S12 methylthiotransferase RimO [Lachnospiraceae bacterium]